MKIEYSKTRHIELVNEALNYKNQKKAIFVEDSQASLELTFYQTYLQDYIFWTKKRFCLINGKFDSEFNNIRTIRKSIFYIME